MLNDQRVSRHHAHIRTDEINFTLIDGYFIGAELKRSINKVFVNGAPFLEKLLVNGDQITIGGSKLEVEAAQKLDSVTELQPTTPEHINFEDQPLGQTQMLMSASEIIGKHSNISIESDFATPEEIRLRGIKLPQLERNSENDADS